MTIKAPNNDPILVPVTTLEQVEWLRVNRNKPEMYKYFRQDAPITPEQQARWWRAINKQNIRLFIIEIKGERVGYIGFNPYLPGAGRAEFGIFILSDHEGKGYGTCAMRKLLEYGFLNCHLRTIYSDVLDYPGEHRFNFYKNLGFEAFPAEHQIIRYKKNGKMIPAIKFFMTKDMWEALNDQNRNGGLESSKKATIA